MSTVVKVLVAVVVLAGLGWLLWWGGWLKRPASQQATEQQTATTTQTQPQPIDGMSANNDTSDAALSQDAAAVDTQMQGLSGDSTNIDASLNDKPLPQSY